MGAPLMLRAAVIVLLIALIPSHARAQDEEVRFVRRVLADTEQVWDRVFEAAGKRYTPPTLVLFTGGTQSACGTIESAMGPFYCAFDEKIFLDLSNYDEMKRRALGTGDNARAYVIAREVSHHVQKLLGITDKVQNLKEHASDLVRESLQVRMELQADCLVGVWSILNGRIKRALPLQPGDAGLNATLQIGDETLQKLNRIVPGTSPSASSEKRGLWFARGVYGEKISVCDTFGATYRE
jgi:predicted metalloprotease